MLRPTPGELLAGVCRELGEQVLPHVPEGDPARQLRAALHVLGRLERSWDLMPTYLEADNADLRRCLAHLAEHVEVAWGEPSAAAVAIPGVSDPVLRALMAENARLQAELDRVQQEWRIRGDRDPGVDADLMDLHLRMAERASRAAALPEVD